MNDQQLHDAIQDAIRVHRSQGRIPHEILLDQDAWNTLRRRMTYARYGSKNTVQLDGVPCVMVVGLKRDHGFVVRAVEPG